MTELEYNYLAHHGILGQRWGRHNGPPYPLDASDHSSAEKKNLSKSLSGKRHEEMYNRKSKSNSNNSEKKDFHLTDQQKKYIKMGATVAATALVAYGGYKLSTNPKFRRLVGKGIDVIAKRPSVDDLLKNSGPIIVNKKTGKIVDNIDDIIVPSNIDLSKYSAKVQEAYNKALDIAKNMNPTGSDINCGPCSILCHVDDKLGTKLKAANVSMSDYGGFSKYFKGYDKTSRAIRVNLGQAFDIQESYSDMIDQMTSFGNGAGGVCSGKWNGSKDGHFLHWKVVDKMVLFSDGQTGNVYIKDAFDKVFSDMDYRSLAFSRLDDLDILKEALKDIAL